MYVRIPDSLPTINPASHLTLANQILSCARTSLSGGKVLESGRVIERRENLYCGELIYY